MPKRIRNHILEDESKEHIRNLLPSHWIFREMSSDYGSDGQVEIWDLEGQNAVSTGLFFNVQLKATDSSKRKTQRKLSVKTHSFDYWMSQTIPTLLIRYATNKGEPIAYFCWNYDRELIKSKEGLSYSIDFSEQNKWNDTTPSKIRDSIIRDRAIHSPTLSLPITLNFINGKDYREEESIIREELEGFREYVTFRKPKDAEPVLELNYVGNSLNISAGSRNLISVGSVTSDRENIAYDIILSVGMCLSMVGQKSHLPKIVEKTLLKCVIINNPKVSCELFKRLFSLEGIHHYRSLVYEIIRRGAPQEVVYTVLMHSLNQFKNIPDSELEKHYHFLEEIELVLIEKMPQFLGYHLFIKGTYLTSIHRPEEGLHAFMQAIVENEDIARNPYLWKQAGGLFYWKDDYKNAETCYLVALKFKHEHKWETLANYADCLWRRGKLVSSIRWLKKALEHQEFDTDTRYSFFHLLLLSLDFTSEYLDSNRLFFNREEAEKEILSLEKEKKEFSDKVVSRLLKKDVSNSWLWGKLAENNQQLNPSFSFKCRILEALCFYRDAKTWAYLLLDAFREDTCDEKLRNLVLGASIRLSPAFVARELHVLAQKHKGENYEYLKSIAEYLETIENPVHKRQIRPV